MSLMLTTPSTNDITTSNSSRLPLYHLEGYRACDIFCLYAATGTLSLELAKPSRLRDHHSTATDMPFPAVHCPAWQHFPAASSASTSQLRPSLAL
ncbi:hypothetical protein Hypma_007944 [Hypsizygus marmoreus]|uniref:Uncharacterized protein n=1 Tax=Hypsizygus marmoreus TaxID=39966 RepID=A0A369JYM7_HYPMA|nr:hypothetical protein Hypma_007944 [Hypsizygus marmoreus]